MPSTHHDLGSPVSPLSSRNESFGPLSKYHQPSIPKQQPQQHSQHQNPVQPVPTVSPIGDGWPDSPTLGYLSPVSIMSPHQARSPEPPRAAAAEAHGPTAHLQDHMPFKPAKTRFPPRKAADNQSRAQAPAKEAEAEIGPSRPATTYLADRIPHKVAPAPTKPINRPRYGAAAGNHGGRAGEGGRDGFQNVELQEGLGSNGGHHAQNARTREPMDGERGGRDVEGKGGMKTEEERKARSRNCLIGWVFVLALVVAIVVLAVLTIEAHKSGGVAA